mmetsp:Transcript_16491/g.40617  ORF Transcript_16491/g.40617 Transcript_16491/m.40617 type:complete len:745 (-) Transcript_16491:674-2908(-)|eukprot:CAMPEP_0114502910 /NCGR_PEP_ID=MMETSP0109-20121206/9360_1 /TAXON_ID=29199 /ORGANISM="Chlorarachnion reptans, Strain CCCM449" /LENGTH=744 /DNA_ID=CAMNT_0001680891 /DNA_START=110 /DNA_END=2344 /DNA_ORIENTATION=+
MHRPPEHYRHARPRKQSRQARPHAYHGHPPFQSSQQQAYTPMHDGSQPAAPYPIVYILSGGVAFWAADPNYMMSQPGPYSYVPPQPVSSGYSQGSEMAGPSYEPARPATVSTSDERIVSGARIEAKKLDRKEVLAATRKPEAKPTVPPSASRNSLRQSPTTVKSSRHTQSKNPRQRKEFQVEVSKSRPLRNESVEKPRKNVKIKTKASSGHRKLTYTTAPAPAAPAPVTTRQGQTTASQSNSHRQNKLKPATTKRKPSAKAQPLDRSESSQPPKHGFSTQRQSETHASNSKASIAKQNKQQRHLQLHDTKDSKPSIEKTTVEPNLRHETSFRRPKEQKIVKTESRPNLSKPERSSGRRTAIDPKTEKEKRPLTLDSRSKHSAQRKASKTKEQGSRSKKENVESRVEKACAIPAQRSKASKEGSAAKKTDLNRKTTRAAELRTEVKKEQKTTQKEKSPTNPNSQREKSQLRPSPKQKPARNQNSSKKPNQIKSQKSKKNRKGSSPSKSGIQKSTKNGNKNPRRKRLNITEKSSSISFGMLDHVAAWVDKYQQTLLIVTAVLLACTLFVLHQPKGLTENESLIEALNSHSLKLAQEHHKLNEELQMHSKENHYLREWMRQMHSELMYTSEEYRQAHTATNLQLLPHNANEHNEDLHHIRQAYTVAIPVGIYGGQDFEVDVNNVIYIVSCPGNGGPGQTIAFDIPTPNEFAIEHQTSKKKIIASKRGTKLELDDPARMLLSMQHEYN